MARGLDASGFDPLGLAYVVVVVVVMFAPLLFARRRTPPTEGGSDDGGGRGPRRPSSPPPRPMGGLPLPSAEPARARLRDHARLADHRPGFARRPRHRPRRRTPTRVA